MLQRIFGVEFSRPFIPTDQFNSNFHQCVSKDLESVVLTASKILELQKRADARELVDLNKYQNDVNRCIAGAKKLFSELATANTYLSSLNLFSSQSASNSQTCNWLRDKLEIPGSNKFTVKSHLSAISDNDQSSNMIDLSKHLSANQTDALEALIAAIDNAKEMKVRLFDSLHTIVPEMAKHLSACAARIGTLVNYDVVEDAESELKQKGIEIDFSDIKPFPQAVEFSELYKNPHRYIDEQSSACCHKEKQKVILRVEGKGIYQGFNLENLPGATTDEQSLMKKEIKHRFSEMLLSSYDGMETALKSLDLTFEDINSKVFTNKLQIIATPESIAVCPVVTDDESVSKAVALLILKRLKDCNDFVYQKVNEACRCLSEFNRSVVDPRIALAVAGRINPELNTVFSNYPLTAHNEMLIASISDASIFDDPSPKARSSMSMA